MLATRAMHPSAVESGIQGPSTMKFLQSLEEQAEARHKAWEKLEQRRAASTAGLSEILSLHQRSLSFSGVRRPGTIPYLPIEIHAQILSHILPNDPFPTGCGFCHLFSLHGLLFVSPVYASLISDYIYKALPLNLSTQTAVEDPHAHCQTHHHLSSKRKQLQTRLPLLLRTLKERPDLAQRVKSIHLPAASHTYLTCSLEKQILPELLRICSQVEEVRGLETLLERQFYNREHFCLDGGEAARHGTLVKTAVGLRNLKIWEWSGGMVTDLWARVLQQDPEMTHVNFQNLHANWSSLEELRIDVSWYNLESECEGLFNHLPKLRKIRIGTRHPRGPRDREMLDLLAKIPLSVETIEFDGLRDVGPACAWLQQGRLAGTGWSRHSLQDLSVIGSSLDVEAVSSILGSVVQYSESVPDAGSRAPTPLTYSCVRRVKLDNAGHEAELFGKFHESLPTPNSDMELAGLEELSFGIYSIWKSETADDGHMCALLWLAAALRVGWFRDLKYLQLRVPDEEEGLRLWGGLMRGVRRSALKTVMVEDPLLRASGGWCSNCTAPSWL